MINDIIELFIFAIKPIMWAIAYLAIGCILTGAISNYNSLFSDEYDKEMALVCLPFIWPVFLMGIPFIFIGTECVKVGIKLTKKEGKK